MREAFDLNDALVGRVLVSPALTAAALLYNVMPGASSRWAAVDEPARERSL
jgi:hypothetical protein